MLFCCFYILIKEKHIFLTRKELFCHTSISMEEHTHSRKYKLVGKHVTLGIFLITLAIAIVTAGYFYHKYRSAQQLLANPNYANQLHANQIVQQVEKLMTLPPETPTIATVSDITKLRSQAFFSQARNGDIVLIYASAKKAILYDPILNKIVNVGPINIPNTLPSPTAIPTLFPLVTPTPAVNPVNTSYPKANPQ
jgi:hypothetical protein